MLSKEQRLALMIKIQNELYQLHKCYDVESNAISKIDKAMQCVNDLYALDDDNNASLRKIPVE
jgi:hypothetical protein